MLLKCDNLVVDLFLLGRMAAKGGLGINGQEHGSLTATGILSGCHR